MVLFFFFLSINSRPWIFPFGGRRKAGEEDSLPALRWPDRFPELRSESCRRPFGSGGTGCQQENKTGKGPGPEKDHSLGLVSWSILGCEGRRGAAFQRNISRFSSPCVPPLCPDKSQTRRWGRVSAFHVGPTHPGDGMGERDSLGVRASEVGAGGRSPKILRGSEVPGLGVEEGCRRPHPSPA